MAASLCLESLTNWELIRHLFNMGEYLAAPKEFVQKWAWDRQRHPVICRRIGNIERNKKRKDLYRVLDCKVAFNQKDMRDLAAYLKIAIDGCWHRSTELNWNPSPVLCSLRCLIGGQKHLSYNLDQH